jgi:hypothetical protein
MGSLFSTKWGRHTKSLIFDFFIIDAIWLGYWIYRTNKIWATTFNQAFVNCLSHLHHFDWFRGACWSTRFRCQTKSLVPELYISFTLFHQFIGSLWSNNLEEQMKSISLQLFISFTSLSRVYSNFFQRYLPDPDTHTSVHPPQWLA